MSALEVAPAIIGAFECGIAFSSGRRGIDLAAEAAFGAMRDARLELTDIDGLCVAKGGDLSPADRPSLELAEYLGMEPSWVDTTLSGGSSSILQIGRTIDALAAGRARRVLVVYGSSQGTDRQRSLAGHARRSDDPIANAERGAGLPQPLGVAALAAARYMYEYGTTTEQLASVAVSDRAWAALNPNALMRGQLTVADACAAALICDPLRRTDCALVTDGAAAIVIEANAAAHSGPLIVGYAEHHSHNTVFGSKSLVETDAGRTGPAALAAARLHCADIDLVGLYDAFSILPILLLEDIGFCPKGSAGSFVLEGRTSPSGDLPMNTQGGGLSHCHPGYYGLFLVVEAVQQLRGLAGDRQVIGVEHALCHTSTTAVGGTNVTLVLRAS